MKKFDRNLSSTCYTVESDFGVLKFGWTLLKHLENEIHFTPNTVNACLFWKTSVKKTNLFAADQLLETITKVDRVGHNRSDH